jgi:hypothetical protein
VKSVASVTTVFSGITSFSEDEVRRLTAGSVPVRGCALSGVGRQFRLPVAGRVARFDPARSFERCIALFAGCAANPPATPPAAGR